ncbi:MAG: hypothetical protein QOD66_3624, partial [Solirubrobacteraceae bacterium]|nr:hypothetical protein [Solirubrobacteraceae bacterium]
ADCDLRRGLHAKRWFDSVGHYGREELLFHPPEPRAGASAADAADPGRPPDALPGMEPPPARTP